MHIYLFFKIIISYVDERLVLPYNSPRFNPEIFYGENEAMAKRKKPNIKGINISDVPMLEESSGGHRLIGKRYKLSIGKFITNLFELNEDRAKSQKWHDGQIALAICKEYVDYPASTEKYDVLRTDSRQVRKNIAQIRGEYNAGKLVLHSGPASGKKYSFQYDKNGNAVNAKTKNYRPLSLAVMAERRNAADKRRQRWIIENK